MQKNILLILTGGTICSFADSKGERDADTLAARALIIDNFRNGTSPYRSKECVKFDSKFPLNILSENLTPDHWNTLIGEMRTYDFSSYDGIIILHGTDTLAYTAALFSLLLAGICVPVIFVSSQLGLNEGGKNGNDNFKAAVELIVNGISPNVYAVYRNDETMGNETKKTLYLHYAAHLLQCAAHSDNFYSCDMQEIAFENAEHAGRRCASERMILNDARFGGISANVLKLSPYVGIDYSKYSLDGVDAVVHGTYHSSTVPINPCCQSTDISKHSITYLKKKCDEAGGIPLFIEPCGETAYVSTGNALRDGILPIRGLSSEMAYIKTLLGCSLGLRAEELYNFINKTNVNDEFV